MLSANQRRKFKRAIKEALSVLKTVEPMTAVEWADENFYMSSESSYIEGKWQTVPFQIAILNAMGNDEIEEVNWQKCARVGYTKLLCAVIGYFIEHKKRNVMAWSPDDGARDDFSKQHIDPMIRDVSAVKSLFPWLGKKHKNNTIESKAFVNQKMLHLKGGKAAKNYREKSVDVGIYDELSKFDSDVEKEGSPTILGDKRLEGSVYRKSIRGSSPTIDGVCQIQSACSEAEHVFLRHVPCPHCKKHRPLVFGGKELNYGLTWDQDVSDSKKPNTVKYVCQCCGAESKYADYIDSDYDGYWESERGLRTWDGIKFYHLDGDLAETPLAVAFKIWAAYSHFSPWTRIVKDFLKIKGDRDKLKAFVNTTLGEQWIEDEGEQLDSDTLYNRREHYEAEVPVEDCVMTAAVDVQDDRLEIEYVAWVAGEENYRISYERLYGDLSRKGIWNTLYKRLDRPFKTPSGVHLQTRLVTIDSGGHFTDEVYQFSKKSGVRRFIPIKGSSIPGKPIAKFPRKRNEKGVYLTTVGTDTAKEVIMSRLLIMEPGEGYTHYPVNDEFDEDYFVQLTTEKRIKKFSKGKWIIAFDSGGRRNEPFDTSVYNLVAIRILQQHYGVDLSLYRKNQIDAEEFEELAQQPKPQPQHTQQTYNDNFVKVDGDWL